MDGAAEYDAKFVPSNVSKATRVKVSQSSRILDGTEGEKILANVSLDKDISGSHIRKFFIKRPNELPDCPETIHDAIIEKYKWLKVNGFPVPPTYRYDQERREFLITDMNQFGKIHDKANPLTYPINNINEVIEHIKELAKKSFSDGNGVYLGLDSYSVIVDEYNNGHVYLLDLGRGSYRIHEGVDEKGRTKLPHNAEAIAQNFIDSYLPK